MKFIKYFLLLLLVAAAGLYFYKRQPAYTILYGDTMGTYYSIKVNSTPDNNTLPNQEVKAELALIDKQMSVFDPDSELSKINKAEANAWIPISEELSVVLEAAYSVYQSSNGYFDPTVGSLIDLWGFGSSKQKLAPEPAAVKEALKYSGFDKIRFSKDFRSIKKLDGRTYINLSALAKGYGVDKVAELLLSLGYKNFVVEIGGEVRAVGQKSGETNGWNIGVLNPDTNENEYVITLKNNSVATSGDYRNFHMMDGKRYSHTISPKTGYPVEHGITSVTVFDKSCMKADALATAIMAMGEKRALDYANANGLSAIIFTRSENDQIKIFVSNKAKTLLGSQYAPSGQNN